MDISETSHLLGDILGEVLIEQESRELVEVEERIRARAKERRSDDAETAQAGADGLKAETARLETGVARAIAAAFALYFDLVNTAEDNYRMDVLRQEALENAPDPVHDSIEEAVRLLKES